MTVDEPLTTGLAQAILVEEQVPETVVAEGTIQEFHALRLMGLTATDDDGSRFRHLAKITLLVRLRKISVIFVMLKCSDHKIASLFQAADLPGHPIHIADRRARPGFTGLGE